MEILGVERADDLGEVVLVVRRSARRRCRARAGRARRSARSTSANRSRCSGSAGTTSTVGRPISAFSAGGRALGDDPAVVDDPDPVGEDVGLLEVLRGQEDGHALLLGEAADLAPRARSGSAGRGRSSARRGRGCADGGRARARGRGGASSRPSRCAPCGRRRRSARRARAARRRGGRAPSRGMPWSAVCRRRCSRPVSSGSSAASWSAAPIAVRTCGPSLTTSKPATVARAGRRRAAAWSACGRSSTCRRRSGRGTRRSRRARRRGRSRRPRARP